MMLYLCIGIGGMLGSITRFLLGKYFEKKNQNSFSWGTAIINITGAILLGVVTTFSFGDSLYGFLGEGFLGAYTTFSTFMYEGFSLYKDKKEINALLYIIGTLIISMIGYYLGMRLIEIVI
jgi:CrcB protein